MKTKCSIAVLSAILALTLPFNCFGYASVNDKPDTSEAFFNKGEEGWFWYKELIPEEQEKEELIPPTPDQGESKPESKPSKPKGPPAFSSAWIKENLPKYEEIAVDNPTQENMKAYLFMQRLAMDKAMNFALAYQEAVVGDALVDENMRRSTSNFGVQAIDIMSRKQTDAMIKVLSEKVGLFFFFTSDCIYCEKQLPVMKYYADETNMAIFGVSVDGKPPAGNTPLEWKPDQGLAERYGITSVPAILAVTPEGDAEPLATGLVAVTEIKRRVLIAAKRRGWISEEEFNLTRPLMFPENNNLAHAMNVPNQKVRKIVESYQNQDGFIEPSKLVPLVQSRAKLTNTKIDLKGLPFERAAEPIPAEQGAK